MTDPVVIITVWRGPQSALAARMGIDSHRMATLLKRCAFKRGGHLEIEVASPTAMQSLKRVLRTVDNEP